MSTSSSASHCDVRPIDAAMVLPTAQLLARAFEVDPAYRYLFADPAGRTRGLTDFFARNLQTHLPYRCTQVALDERGGLLGSVTLRPPGGVPISTLTMLRRGLLPFMWAHGREPVRRMLWLKRTYDALEQELAQHGRHRHLHMMAVAPQHQGRGVGGQLLRHVLEHAGPATPECPTVLTTHLPRNLEFYRRAGFELHSERELHPPGSESYAVWSMRSA